MYRDTREFTLNQLDPFHLPNFLFIHKPSIQQLQPLLVQLYSNKLLNLRNDQVIHSVEFLYASQFNLASVWLGVTQLGNLKFPESVKNISVWLAFFLDFPGSQEFFFPSRRSNLHHPS